MYANWKEALRAIKHEKENNCCTVIATAIACGVRFSKAKRVLKKVAKRKKGRGVRFNLCHHNVFGILGHKLVVVPVCSLPATVKTAERWASTPENKDKVFLVYVKGHVLTIRKGAVIDWTQGRRHRILQVFEVLPTIEE